VAKPLAVAAMVGAVLVSFFHYIKVGPIEVKDGLPDDERGDGSAHDPAEGRIT
jgi:formate dehydrogenase iron-sulfur subunit